MRNFIFLRIARLRQNYWFWPSAMTLLAVILGFALPSLDAALGSDWIPTSGFLRATQVDGARAILTTLAGATLGVAGVAFSVTIVAVSFASSNYGPRLIGNFMGDRTNQIVLGVFVATFVYCIIVLSTVHGSLDVADASREAFVPQISILFALVLTLAAVGALIGYIHHIPESINIMNLAAHIGHTLQRRVIDMLEDETAKALPERGRTDVQAFAGAPRERTPSVVRTTTAGYVQQIDLESLVAVAQDRGIQIVIHRAPGDFLAVGEPVMSVTGAEDRDGSIARRLDRCYTQGANRTDVQDLLFLSDQLVEVLGRALSPGVNDPHTAMLCLDWLRAGLSEFARRPPPRPARPDDPVLYRRVTFEEVLDRSFDRMRQYVAADRTVTLHAIGVLRSLAEVASRPAMAEACLVQMRALTASAREVQAESLAREEIDAELVAAERALAPQSALRDLA